MRGPTNNTNTVEDTETEGSFEETIRNDNLSGHVICSRSVSTASSKKEEEDGTPIWKVGRMLMDSLSKGKMRRSKIFGAPLEDLPLNCQGMPKIAHRLCCYLEQYGLKEPDLFGVCKKQGKLVERYKISFDRAGDADLESCNDVKVIASLLKLWLHDLPHPLIPQRLIARLTTVFQKYERKEVYDLNAELCNVLLACPALNLGVLYTVVRLLYFYVTKWYPASYVDQLPEMFAKILIGDSMIEHVEIVTTLIHNFRDIFNERILERAFKLYLVREKKNRDGVDLTITGDCGNVSLSSVDKLIRSNSEEKLSIRSDHNRNLAMKNLNMRRVNSHEDFSGHLQHGYCKPVQVVIVDNQQNGASDADNMSRYQISRLYDPQYDEPVVDSFNRITYFAEKDAEVLVAPPPFNYNEDYKLQEEIRNTERFTPQFNMYRNVGRRKRGIYQGHSVKPKIKAVFEQNTSIPPYGGESKPNNFYDEISCNVDGFANESNRSPTESTFQDSDTHSISSTSSDSSSESSSPTRMNSSPEPAQYFNDISEPLTSYENWSFAHRHPHNSNIERSVSPKIPINLSHHSHDLSASSHAVHLSGIEMKILQVNKHLQWVKRKKKRFEEDFESKFGETASISNKMAHPEYKQMSASIIHLKNNLKQLRKEANESFSAHRLHITKNPNNSVNLGLFSSSPIDKEKAVQEAEKQLCEKRIATERPECVEDMTHEQLLDEKVSIQRELLHLESTFGQTAARNEDLFHPIYSRYRTVKRFLARSTASLKLKEASSDLATIIENETMDFDPANTIATMCEDKSTSAECQPLCNADGSDVRISNIHELSSPELMMEYKATKDEKKKLRNRIYMYEQEAENKTLNDSKYCIHTLRTRYKNTKAKLKLLEALLTKSK